MSERKYLKKITHPYPHIGNLVRKVMTEKHITTAELARRMGLSHPTVGSYLLQQSVQFGILWNLGIALEYDFLSELTNTYPDHIPPNPKAKIVVDLREKETKIADLEKEIGIYKNALGIRQ